MCFSKTVDGSLVGRAPGTKAYVAMGVVPMGWLNAVSVIQAAVRTLVFDEASVPPSSEVSKLKELPTSDDLTVIYQANPPAGMIASPRCAGAKVCH